MSFITEVETKLSDVKAKAEGDLHNLVLKLEGILQRVHQVEVSGVFKQAVISDIHAAAVHAEAVADTLRSDVDVVDKAADTADEAVDEEAAK
jgi:hypothetical protein